MRDRSRSAHVVVTPQSPSMSFPVTVESMNTSGPLPPAILPCSFPVMMDLTTGARLATRTSRHAARECGAVLAGSDATRGASSLALGYPDVLSEPARRAAPPARNSPDLPRHRRDVGGAVPPHVVGRAADLPRLALLASLDADVEGRRLFPLRPQRRRFFLHLERLRHGVGVW